jgi:beta-glucosidase
MKVKILAPTILFALSAIASPIFAQQAAPPDDAPYKNPKLPTDQRVKDLISRMTLEEKAAQVGHTAPAIPRLGVPEYNWWNEGLHGVARAGIATVFPQGDRPRRNLRRAADAPGRRHDQHGIPREVFRDREA